jgi:oligosaccharide repeat unit polymerase
MLGKFHLENKHLIIYLLISLATGAAISVILYNLLDDFNIKLLKFLLALALLFLAGSGFIVHFTKFLLNKERIDPFSPSIFFPLIFAFMYGFGSIGLGKAGLEIPISQFHYYFIGIFAYIMGLLLSNLLAGSLSKQTENQEEWIPKRLRNSIILFILIFLISAIFVFRRTTLPLFFGPDVENLRTEFVHIVSGYVYYLFRIPEIVLMLFFVYILIQKKRLFSRPSQIFLVLFCLFFLFSLMERRALVVPLFVGVVCYHYLRKRLSLGKIVLAAILFFIAVSLMGLFRATGPISFDKESIGIRFSHEINLYASVFLMTTEVIPQQERFLGWNGFIQPFRVILPGTQRSIGDILKYDIIRINFRGGGFMPSILGGFYMNFGYWGIIVGMFLVGTILNSFYLFMLKRRNEFSILLYAYVSIYFLSAIPGMVLAEIWPLFVLFLFFITNAYCRNRQGPNLSCYAQESFRAL